MKKTITKGQCERCDRWIAVKSVGGNWLNAVYPVRHNDPKTKKECIGTYVECLSDLRRVAR